MLLCLNINFLVLTRYLLVKHAKQNGLYDKQLLYFKQFFSQQSASWIFLAVSVRLIRILDNSNIDRIFRVPKVKSILRVLQILENVP